MQGASSCCPVTGRYGTWHPADRLRSRCSAAKPVRTVMMFEEATPAGTVTPYHLHHDSDEITYVLSGQMTFKIGDEITVGGPGTCAFMPRGIAHAWKNTGLETGHPLLFSRRVRRARYS